MRFERAERRVAAKAVVGVRGNRSGVAEITRDTLGIDDCDRNRGDDDGFVSRLRGD
jgi:hypothetical protein